MNAAALNMPWASSTAAPVTSAAIEPQPSTIIMKPSWLIVPIANSSLRSVWRSARTAPTSIVTAPTVTTTGRHHPRIANAGANRATR